MKRFLSLLLAMILMTTCLLLISCGGGNDTESESTTETDDQETPEAVSRFFVAGYEKTVAMGETETKMSGRVIMDLKPDGTLDLYVGFIGMAEHQTAHYTGTYTLGENEEFDETISFTYTYGEGETATVTDAVIIDGIFEAPFYMVASMTSNPIKFYETQPIDLDGDVYVGYMTKTGGMGAMVNAYILCMKDGGTFDVSIMQMASVMHVWDDTNGTYTVDGDKITFTYDVVSDEGVVAEDYTSEGKEYSETRLLTGFNIYQASVHASDAEFIRVK